MKKGEQPELSARWWKATQPKGLKSAGRLEDAFKSYEVARRKLEQNSDSDAAKAAVGALDAIEPAARAVISEASKAKNAPEMDATVDALKKLDRLYATEQTWIEEHAAKGDDDEDDISDPDAYREYLLTGLKRLRTGAQMNFGFVLGKKPEDHRLALHRSKGSKALANGLVKQTGLHAMTFGTALAHADKAEVLLLVLEGRQLPGMKKKGERMLKALKPLPFNKLAVVVEGKEVEDLVDPDDTDIDTDTETDSDRPAGEPPAEAAAIARSRANWVAARQSIEGDLEKLRAAMLSAYQGHGVAQDLETAYRTRVQGMLASLDTSLAGKLDEAGTARDPAEHAKATAEAAQIIQRYESYVANEPIIAALDRNPFVPLAIRRTIDDALSSVSDALRRRA